MDEAQRQKVQAGHLTRKAYLYIRQSTLHQVLHNTESADRQYGLRRRAAALGWHEEDIVTIDCDTGQSGASAKDREGFQQLVTEVGLGRAGIVLGLEVSRLARNSSDWHRLLEICALSDTLILDEDGLYDPSHFNDRLLLGMKGTMSEAELHVLTARLQGGLRNKAERGELRTALPVGLVHDTRGQVALDPDASVRESLELFFRLFRQLGSAHALVAHFRTQRLVFPRRIRFGARRGDLAWGPLTLSRALSTLHNPRYAGTFAYGRYRTRAGPGGARHVQAVPQAEWPVAIPDAHPGYIEWEEWQCNQKTLAAGKRAWGSERERNPGEGPALLQGIAICGVCGRRMGIRYQSVQGRLAPVYHCMRQKIECDAPLCQQVSGRNIDAAIGALLLETMTAEAVELSLAVQEEVQTRVAEADRLRHRHVERAEYEAEAARERFMAVDPRNRLVAGPLEADWNERLRRLEEARATYEDGRAKDRRVFDEDAKERIRALVRDLPAVWNDARVSDQQRKRIVRLLLEDVTVLKGETRTRLQIRFRGGATRTLEVANPLSAWEARKTPRATVELIDRLLDEYPPGDVARRLRDRGILTSMGSTFTTLRVMAICESHGIKSRYARLRERGLLTQEELALTLGVSAVTIRMWYHAGLLCGHAYGCRGRGSNRLYERPERGNEPQKMLGRPLAKRVRCSTPASSSQ